MKLQPDGNLGNPEAEEKFKVLLRVYETLLAELNVRTLSALHSEKRHSTRSVENENDKFPVPPKKIGSPPAKFGLDIRRVDI